MGQGFRAPRSTVARLSGSDPESSWGEKSDIGQTEGDAVEFAREQLMRQFTPGREEGRNEDPLWVQEDDSLDDNGLPRVGTVLVANPAAYFGGDPEGHENLAWPAGERTLNRQLDEDASRRERADLPVVLITGRTANATVGVQLSIWSGKLLGDLDFPNFMTRPLYIGGTEPGVLSFLHPYPEAIPGAAVTDDGLAVSSAAEYAKAVDFVERGTGSPWRLKFFTRRVVWPLQEEREMRPSSGVWLPVRCSRDLLLREPDSSYEEPLWAQIAERAGGALESLGRAYGLLAS